MKSNMGNTDRLVRLVLAVLLGVLWFFNIGGDTAKWVFLILGIVMAATSLIRFCPLYTLFGLNSNENKQA